jgi:hypothetical protein
LDHLADLRERISWISAFYAVMIEDEKEHPQRARELAERWARIHEQVARQLRDDRVPKSHVREIALALLLSDLQDTVAQAGIAPA